MATYNEYEDKEALIENPSIPDINKVKANDMNYIKYNLPHISNEVDEDYRVNFVKSKNLYDKDNALPNSRLDASGLVIYQSGYYCSQFIKVKPNTKYTFSANANVVFVYCEYTSGQAFINRYNSSGNTNTFTITTTSNTEYIRFTYNGTNITTMQLEEGDTATTYEAFIPNQILVDNEKYTDTLNVGSVVDNRSRVNVLYSKNLFDMNNVNSFLGYFTSQVSVITGTGSGVKILYIPCKPNTTYTVQKVASKRFSVATTRVEPAVGVAFYGGVFGTTTTTQLTITTDSEAKYLIVEYYIGGSASPDTLSETQILSSIIINEGSVVVDTPSIYVDNEEIYSKPVVLYSNSTGSNGTITLNDDVSNYKYLEIYFDGSNPTRVSMQKMDLSISNGTSLFKWNCDSSGSVYAIIRDIKVSGRTLENFTSGANYSTISYTSSLSKQNANNVYIYKVIGYK